MAMTIYSRWEWQEKTTTFLLIFHFDADFSKTNLRIKEECLWNGKDFYSEYYDPNTIYAFPARVANSMKNMPVPLKVGDTRKITVRNVATWAPSHVEVAILADLLLYANIINGFKEDRRRRLRTRLEFWVKKEELKKACEQGFSETTDSQNTLAQNEEAWEMLRKTLNSNRKILRIVPEVPGEVEDKGIVLWGVELCPEYIDYLKKVIEKY